MENHVALYPFIKSQSQKIYLKNKKATDKNL